MDERSTEPRIDPTIEPTIEPRIEMEPNGPYIVHGPAIIVDADGHERRVETGHSVKLCRCGHSATKPFCDSTHRTVDFVSRPHFEPERP